MAIESAYNQALDYLYSHIDYSLKRSSELAKAHFELGRMRDLMEKLGDPQNAYPIIHVAGTKGKGSTSAMMASVLTAAGYKTGLYTSPHLQDYAERIQINNQPIIHAQLVDLVEQIKPAVAQVPGLTTFEITTALGFLYFAQEHVQSAVIEVGLGGRLDATNIITPLVSVITSLSYDHMTILGNTLALIAGEKAGIIKAGIPVISSPQPAEALSVLETIAADRNASFTLVGREVTFQPIEHSLDDQVLAIHPGQSTTQFPESVILRIPLLGAHQVVNAATACTALRASKLDISDDAIRTGFAKVRWPCRFEIVQREPFVVLDSAHNTDSAMRLRQALDDYLPGRPVILIFSILEDKDAQGMLLALKPRLTKVIATQTNHPRVLEIGKIVNLVQAIGIPVEQLQSVASALNRAIELAGQESLILVAGSVAFAGEMKTIWEKRRTE